MRPLRLPPSTALHAVCLAALALAAGVLPLGCSADRSALKEGLRAYFPFSRSAVNVVGDGAEGELRGATPTPDRYGREERAFAFSDGAAIDVGLAFTDLDLPFTVAAWVLREQPTTRNATVVSSNEGTTVYTGFWMQVDPGGRLELSYGDGGPRKHDARRTKLSTDRVPVGRWTHLAAVVSGPDDIALYVDGADAGGEYGGEGDALVNGDFPALIGRGEEGANVNAWHGAIDEVRVYERALAAEDVWALYSKESPSTTGSAKPWPRIDVLDASGGVVAFARGRAAGPHSELGALAALPAGAYTLRMTTPDSSFDRRIVVE